MKCSNLAIDYRRYCITSGNLLLFNAENPHGKLCTTFTGNLWTKSFVKTFTVKDLKNFGK